MKGILSSVHLALIASIIFAGGCATSEHRQAVAAQKDDERRSEFEHCRAEGRTDCEAILNAPVTNSANPDDVRTQERRNAYDRCVARGGHDCDDLLRR